MWLSQKGTWKRGTGLVVALYYSFEHTNFYLFKTSGSLRRVDWQTPKASTQRGTASRRDLL